jgi:hypothetical protein
MFVMFPILSDLASGKAQSITVESIAPSCLSSEGKESARSIKDLSASFQSVVVHALVSAMEKIANEVNPKTIIVAGGVTCNKALRASAQTADNRLRILCLFSIATSFDRQRSDDCSRWNSKTKTRRASRRGPKPETSRFDCKIMKSSTTRNLLSPV